MTQESSNTDVSNNPEELLEVIRQTVTDSLRAGVPAPDLTGLLTYVAAEMCLQLAPSPLLAVPVLLDAVAKATQAHEARNRDDDEDDIDDDTLSIEHTVH